MFDIEVNDLDVAFGGASLQIARIFQEKLNPARVTCNCEGGGDCFFFPEAPGYSCHEISYISDASVAARICGIFDHQNGRHIISVHRRRPWTCFHK